MLSFRLLVLLLLPILYAQAQSQLTNPLVAYRQALAHASTDSSRGRLNQQLSELAATNDSTRYFALQAIAQLQRVLPATTGRERRRLLGILGSAYNNLGVSYCNSNDWRKGMAYYRQSLRLLEQSDNTAAQVQTLSNMGDEYQAQRNYGAALRYLQLALQRGGAVSAAQRELGYSLASLGTLYRTLGNDSAALRLQWRAVRLLEREASQHGNDLDIRDDLAIALNRLADTYLLAYGDTAQADRYARRAQQLSLSNGYSWLSALAVRGSVYVREQHWAQARTVLLLGQTAAQADQDISRLALLSNDLAVVEENTGHLALALRYAQQAAAVGQLNQPVNKSRSAEILARLYEKLGQPQAALAALKHYGVLRDSITAEDGKRKLLGQLLQTDYERRTTVLQARQAVAAAELRRQQLLLWGLLAGIGLLGLLAGQQWRNRRHQQLATRREQQVNELLLQQKAQLEEQAERLGELDSAKNQFFANVSHELRTPLTLILGPLDGLLHTPLRPLPAFAHQPLALAYRHAQRLRELVNRLLNLTKLQAGQLLLHPTPILLASLLQQLLQQFEPLAEQRHLHLQSSGALPTQLCVLLDADKVTQILTNLLINALNHTPAGGTVVLEAQLPDADGQVAITVRDTGPGIAEVEQARVFERYYQSPQSKVQGGTGLGLAYSRELAALLEGSLTLSSQPGQGAVFTLRFPAPQVPAEVAAPAQEPAEVTRFNAVPQLEASAPISPRARVVIVEDQPDLREYLHQLLLPTYEVLIAADGQEALDLLASTAPVDLIVTDAMMPRVSGLDLLHRLRTNPDLLSVPVLMLTARADEAHRLTALTVGVDDYLTKPFVTSELLARVQALLARQQVRRHFATQPGEPDAEPLPIASATALPSEPVASIASSTRQLTQWQIQATEYLPNPRFGPIELADLLCLSERTLYRRLGELAGLTPAAWLRELRLDQARRLLEAGSFGTVEAVARAAGFGSVRHFTTLYAERFGCRPSSYVN